MEYDKIDINIDDIDDSAEWQSTCKSSHQPHQQHQQFKKKPKKNFKPKNKQQDKRLPFNKNSIIKILRNETETIESKMNMIKDLLSLTTLIKMQNGKITEWAKEKYNFDLNYFKQIFNFKHNSHVISNKITKFKLPVYVPWIELITFEIKSHQIKSKIINHSDGCGMYRYYSNQFFNLNNSDITLSVLDKTWDIDLWLSVLTNIPSIQIYTIDMINTLSALYIELIRSYSITLHGDERKELDIYKNIKIYINDIFNYMYDNNLTVMDYFNYTEWPNNIKIAMDAITEGEIKFYFGSKLFYRINIHNLIYDSMEEAIKYIIDVIYCASEKINSDKEIFELENAEIINNKIIKLIYNILQMPKEVDIKLNTYTLLAGNKVIVYHNKIHLLAVIFKYIIGFERKCENPLSKINKFCLLWNVVKQYSTKKICNERILDEEELDCIEQKLDDIDFIYNVVESTQTNLLGLIQVIGYRLLTILPNTTKVAMNSRQITCIEEFINTKIKNINNVDIIFKMPIEYKLWLSYVKGDFIKKIPYKFNYTPIKLYRERCNAGLISYSNLEKPLTMNNGFNNILSRLLDMKTPDVMGFPFDI